MLDSDTLTIWVYLPLIIFVARAADMSLSTLRIVFIGQGRTVVAPLIGFFEALIWLLVVNQALAHVSNPLCAAAYAGGFAAGNFVGLKVEERLAFGRRILRIILPGQKSEEATAPDLVKELRAAGFGVTVVHGEGRDGAVRLLFTIVQRADVERAITIVEGLHPKAFISVGDVRHTWPEIYPRVPRIRSGWLPWHVLGKTR